MNILTLFTKKSKKKKRKDLLFSSVTTLFDGSSKRKKKKNLFSRIKKPFPFKWPKLKTKKPPEEKKRFVVRLAGLLLSKKFYYTTALILLLITIGTLYLLRDLPSPRSLTNQDNFAVSTQIFDRHGTLLYEIFADENRTPIALSQLPPYVYQASIAIEDQNFYRHWGFDITAIVRAAISNARGGRLEGGSTITQQLVKNALLTRERTFTRKIKEAFLSVLTEILYTKDDILEMYLNYISYGGTSVGIESAAKAYFDKSATELTIAEAALLAGLPQAPSRYSPFGSSPELAFARQQDVLRRMVEEGFITQIEAEEAKSETLTFALSRSDIEAPHFVFYVRDLLYEEYGVDTVEKGGLRVTTTLDLDLHNTIQASVSAEIANLDRYRVGNGAALVLKPNTGEILSMVGSKDYFDTEKEGQVNVVLAERQPGSSIKPLMYATAFQEKVLNPGSILIDAPTCFTVPGQKPYCPKNYDGSFKGPVSIRDSLGNSLNIPAVKALRITGLEEFMDQATAMGITSWTDPSQYGLSLTLGGGEVRMIDLAQAFASLANEGVKVPLNPILKIVNYKGEIIRETDTNAIKEDLALLTEFDAEKNKGDLERVMDRAPAYLASHIMQDNNARRLAFGTRSELVIPNQIVSAKTGTTNNLKDNWTVGFTPEFLTITWVGNNDGSPMNPYLVSGVTGAAPIFNDIMSYILKDREPVWQEKPPDVASGFVCATGLPSSSDNPCSGRYEELYWDQSEPSKSKIYRQQVWIDPTTGLPPPYGEHVDGLILEEKNLYEDPLTPLYCDDCVRAVSEEGNVVYEQRTVTHDYVIETNE